MRTKSSSLGPSGIPGLVGVVWGIRRSGSPTQTQRVLGSKRGEGPGFFFAVTGSDGLLRRVKSAGLPPPAQSDMHTFRLICQTTCDYEGGCGHHCCMFCRSTRFDLPHVAIVYDRSQPVARRTLRRTMGAVLRTNQNKCTLLARLGGLLPSTCRLPHSSAVRRPQLAGVLSGGGSPHSLPLLGSLAKAASRLRLVSLLA